MKKRTAISVLIVLAVMLVAGLVFVFYSRVSNPWGAATIGSIPAPAGFKREAAASGSYSEFIRSIPLKKRGAPVLLYKGGKANFQFLSTGVVDWPLISNDEQCADVTMRIRAEYFYKTGQYSKIVFKDSGGKQFAYRGGASRKSFESYLRTVYGNCYTGSVYKETKPRAIKDVKPGDVLVYPARKGRKYGHAILVADVARSRSGKVAIMCVEGNTPARSIHVLRNPLNPFRNPWFVLNGDEEVIRAVPFTFHKDELRYYQ